MHLNKVRKIVIKLGSSTIVDKKGNFKKNKLLHVLDLKPAVERRLSFCDCDCMCIHGSPHPQTHAY